MVDIQAVIIHAWLESIVLEDLDPGHELTAEYPSDRHTGKFSLDTVRRFNLPLFVYSDQQEDALNEIDLSQRKSPTRHHSCVLAWYIEQTTVIINQAIKREEPIEWEVDEDACYLT